MNMLDFLQEELKPQVATIIFLGTGKEPLLESKDRNRRRKSALLIKHNYQNLLIDLREGTNKDAIILTRPETIDKEIPVFTDLHTYKLTEAKDVKKVFNRVPFQTCDLKIIPFKITETNYGFYMPKLKLTYINESQQITKPVREFVKKANYLIYDGSNWKNVLRDLKRFEAWEIPHVYFTNITEDVPEYNEAEQHLQRTYKNAHIAYDGLKLEI